MCVDLDPAWAAAIGLKQTGSYDVTFQATVTANGPPTVSGCWSSGATPSDGSIQAQLLVTDAQGRTGIVLVTTPGGWFTPGPGTEIEVRTKSTGPSWTPASATTIRAGGALRLFTLEANDRSTFGQDIAPELTFERGEESCGGSDGCGSWSDYGLRVGANGVERMVAPGETATLGSFRVYLASWSISSSSSCPDWNHDVRRWSVYLPAPSL